MKGKGTYRDLAWCFRTPLICPETCVDGFEFANLGHVRADGETVLNPGGMAAKFLQEKGGLHCLIPHVP